MKMVTFTSYDVWISDQIIIALKLRDSDLPSYMRLREIL